MLDDPYAFARFKSQAKIAVQNGEVESELPYVATLMESEVNHELFASDEFAAFREDHSDELTGDASPMKIYVADKIARARLVESAETEKLAKAGREKVAGIITTNYDCMCETLFPGFRPTSEKATSCSLTRLSLRRYTRSMAQSRGREASS